MGTSHALSGPGPAWRGAGTPEGEAAPPGEAAGSAAFPRSPLPVVRDSPLNDPKPDATLLDRQVCFSLYRASHALGAVYRSILDPYGLTFPQYLVMLALWDRDRVPVRDLSDRVCLDSGTLSPLLRRLTQHGLVLRTRDRSDERRVVITLTERGDAMRVHAQEIQEQLLSATGLDADELFTLRSLSTKLADTTIAPHRPPH
ncbi:MarR family winged helix-turn-helix transcriptional regulator [Schaalia naturae]|uniref:MarR family winged helix-turn-helix transcriptional regulator n=1 Tax=Schaalia naturae TaxID=635203 RepID=A0ABW2SIQ7_9ACTO